MREAASSRFSKEIENSDLQKSCWLKLKITQDA